MLIGSNCFMTTAWYWHLRYKEVPLFSVILISWALAFVEYCLAVPANRYGNAVYNPAQLKTMQEVITLTVFARVFDFLSQGSIDLEPGLSASHLSRSARFLCFTSGECHGLSKTISPATRARCGRTDCR